MSTKCSWICATCTFINHTPSSRCKMCQTQRLQQVHTSWSWNNHGKLKLFQPETCQQIENGIQNQWNNTKNHILKIPLTTGSYFSRPNIRNKYICKVELNQTRTEIKNVYQENISTKYRRTMKRNPSVTHLNRSHNKPNLNNNLNAANLTQNDITCMINQFSGDYTQSKNVSIKSVHNSKCNLNHCSHLKQICQILNSYSSWSMLINLRQRIDLQNFVFGNDYNNVQLLNDFHHLLTQHTAEFEQIYNQLNDSICNGAGCNLSKCAMMTRNYRNRTQCSNSNKFLSKMYYNLDSKNVVMLQLLDRIHCYFLHTFDIGYRLTKRDKEMEIKTDEQYDKEMLRINETLQQKHKSSTHNKSCNKFLTTTATECKTNKISEYDYGFRFYYHKLYKNNDSRFDRAALFEITARQAKPGSNAGKTLGYWYINPRYKSLKDELLTNIFSTISKQIYDQLLLNAYEHLSTIYVKSLKCSRGKSAEYYEMKQNDPVLMDHITCVMVYCNFDKLQREFSKTFRKLDNNESDKGLKARHSNFYWLGRRLRECVECIGMQLSDEDLDMDSNLHLYHGVNSYMTFSSLTAYIKVPFSTTCEQAVAVNFMANCGILLKLQVHQVGSVMKLNEGKAAMNTIVGFNCEPFSDYANERERLFIGGMNPIKIISIIETNGINYDAYICGLRKMTKNMSSGGLSLEAFCMSLKDGKRLEKQMEFRLLSHEIHRYYPENKHAREFTGCPEYFKQILHAECMNIKGMIIWNIKGFNNKMQDYFFKDDIGWIKFDVVMNVFPNVSFIGYVSMDLFSNDFSKFKRLNIFESILNSIKQQARLPKSITLLTLLTHRDRINKEIDQYNKDYERYQWGIHLRNSTQPISEKLKELGVDESNLQHAHHQIWKQVDTYVKLFNIDIANLLVLEIKRDGF